MERYEFVREKYLTFSKILRTLRHHIGNQRCRVPLPLPPAPTVLTDHPIRSVLRSTLVGRSYPMMKLILILIPIFLSNSTLAQPPTSYFPHHVGDVRQYRSMWTGEVMFTERFLRDSVGPTGNTFVWYNRTGSVMPGSGIYKIDSVYDVYPRYTVTDTSRQGLLYKLPADSGEAWTFLSGEGDSIVARVVAVFPGSVFGHPVTMKRIEYIRYPPPWASGLEPGT
jgi:hypothetical protein